MKNHTLTCLSLLTAATLASGQGAGELSFEEAIARVQPSSFSQQISDLGIAPASIVVLPEADREAYPYLAGILDEAGEPGSLVAAGVLVHPYWVVTAAHIFFDENSERSHGRRDFTVALNLDDLRSDADYTEYEIDEVVIFPQFDPFELGGNLALLRLKTPAVATDNGVVPVPLALLSEMEEGDGMVASSVGDLLKVVGWGWRDVGGVMTPWPVPQEVSIPIADESTLDSPLPTLPTQIVAGSEGSGRTAFPGIPGAPMLVIDGRTQNSEGLLVAGLSTYEAVDPDFVVGSKLSGIRDFITETIAPSYDEFEESNAVMGDFADPEGDGFANFVEYGLGLDPLALDTVGSVIPLSIDPEDGSALLTVRRPKDLSDIVRIAVSAGVIGSSVSIEPEIDLSSSSEFDILTFDSNVVDGLTFSLSVDREPFLESGDRALVIPDLAGGDFATGALSTLDGSPAVKTYDLSFGVGSPFFNEVSLRSPGYSGADAIGSATLRVLASEVGSSSSFEVYDSNPDPRVVSFVDEDPLGRDRVLEYSLELSGGASSFGEFELVGQQSPSFGAVVSAFPKLDPDASFTYPGFNDPFVHYMEDFSFTAVAGVSYFVTVTTRLDLSTTDDDTDRVFQPFVELLDVDGVPVNASTISEFYEYEGRVGFQFVPESDGDYRVRVTSLEPRGVGGFQVHVTDRPEVPVSLAPTNIAAFNAVQAELEADSLQDLLDFESEGGEDSNYWTKSFLYTHSVGSHFAVNFQATSVFYSPFISVFRVRSKTDSGIPSEIEFIDNSEGIEGDNIGSVSIPGIQGAEYLVVVSSEEEEATGSFTLDPVFVEQLLVPEFENPQDADEEVTVTTIRPGAALTLADDRRRLAFPDDVRFDEYLLFSDFGPRFTGSTLETNLVEPIFLTVTDANGFTPKIEVINQDTAVVEQLIPLSSSDSSSVTWRVEITRDQIYSVRVFSVEPIGEISDGTYSLQASFSSGVSLETLPDIGVGQTVFGTLEATDDPIAIPFQVAPTVTISNTGSSAFTLSSPVDVDGPADRFLLPELIPFQVYRLRLQPSEFEGVISLSFPNGDPDWLASPIVDRDSGANLTSIDFGPGATVVFSVQDPSERVLVSITSDTFWMDDETPELGTYSLTLDTLPSVLPTGN